MSLQEQLEKVQSDLQKIEERRKELQQKEKELLTKLELEEARAAAKKNEEIRKIVEENYGEVDGSNLEIFSPCDAGTIRADETTKRTFET